MIFLNLIDAIPPRIELQIHGHSLVITEHQLDQLVEEIQWIKGNISSARLSYYQSLGKKL